MPNDLPDWQRAVSAPLKVGEVTSPAGALTAATIQIPFGTLAVGFLVDFSGAGGNPTQVTVTGVQSNTVYLSPQNPSGGGPHVAMVAGIDTSVTLSVQSPIAASTHVWLIAWTSQPVVALNPNIEAPVPVTFFSASNPVLVAQPALWQTSPRSTGVKLAPGLNTDFTVIAGLIGQNIYVFDVFMSNNTGGSWELELWDGPSATGVRIGVFVQNYVTAAGIDFGQRWNGWGRKLALGNGLVGKMTNGVAAATCWVTAGFNQG